jgi:hypothetical protein
MGPVASKMYTYTYISIYKLTCKCLTFRPFYKQCIRLALFGLLFVKEWRVMTSMFSNPFSWIKEINFAKISLICLCR